MTVYLLHLSQPLGSERHHAQHYIGQAVDLDRRMCEHRRGGSNTAKLIQAAHRLGVGFTLARTWEGGRDLEKKLKAQKKARLLCPICRGKPCTQQSR